LWKAQLQWLNSIVRLKTADKDSPFYSRMGLNIVYLSYLKVMFKSQSLACEWAYGDGARVHREAHLAQLSAHKKALRRGLEWIEQDPLGDQPPFLERLPGFFLLRVATPRSKLTRWPRPCVGKVTPGLTGNGGVNLRSASVTILLPISGSSKKFNP